MKFIHLSDLHIHRYDASNKKVEELFDCIEKKYKDYYLIITGDITDDGDERQYEKAYNILKNFKDKLFICPGNHDFGAIGNYFSMERAKRFDEMLATPLGQNGTFIGENIPVINVLKDAGNEIILIALDTNLETESVFDYACGEVGEKQLKYLNTILSDGSVKNMTKIIFMHHHPFMVNNPFMELKDARDFFETSYLKADLLLFGHKHESRLWKNADGFKYILASDNSPGKDYAREIIINSPDDITINDLSLIN